MGKIGKFSNADKDNKASTLLTATNNIFAIIFWKNYTKLIRQIDKKRTSEEFILMLQ
jgi:hypothetical protein